MVDVGPVPPPPLPRCPCGEPGWQTVPGEALCEAGHDYRPPPQYLSGAALNAEWLTAQESSGRAIADPQTIRMRAERN